MHSQTDLRWSWKQIALSGRSMRDIGCAITSLAYMISRFDGIDVTPGALLDYLNVQAKHANYSRFLQTDGDVYWNSVDAFTGGHLLNQWNGDGAHYVLTEVRWGSFRHWVVNLSGGLCFNPWSGKPEPLLQAKWTPTGRHQFYRTITPPKT
jgi:hypothetical protein